MVSLLNWILLVVYVLVIDCESAPSNGAPKNEQSVLSNVETRPVSGSGSRRSARHLDRVKRDESNAKYEELKKEFEKMKEEHKHKQEKMSKLTGFIGQLAMVAFPDALTEDMKVKVERKIKDAVAKNGNGKDLETMDRSFADKEIIWSEARLDDLFAKAHQELKRANVGERSMATDGKSSSRLRSQLLSAQAEIDKLRVVAQHDD